MASPSPSPSKPKWGPIGGAMRRATIVKAQKPTAGPVVAPRKDKDSDSKSSKGVAPAKSKQNGPSPLATAPAKEATASTSKSALARVGGVMKRTSSLLVRRSSSSASSIRSVKAVSKLVAEVPVTPQPEAPPISQPIVETLPQKAPETAPAPAPAAQSIVITPVASTPDGLNVEAPQLSPIQELPSPLSPASRPQSDLIDILAQSSKEAPSVAADAVKPFEVDVPPVSQGKSHISPEESTGTDPSASGNTLESPAVQRDPEPAVLVDVGDQENSQSTYFAGPAQEEPVEDDQLLLRASEETWEVLRNPAVDEPVSIEEAKEVIISDSHVLVEAPHTISDIAVDEHPLVEQDVTEGAVDKEPLLEVIHDAVPTPEILPAKVESAPPSVASIRPQETNGNTSQPATSASDSAQESWTVFGVLNSVVETVYSLLRLLTTRWS